MKDSTKMSKQILQDGETIVLQELCDYCKDGAFAIVNTGDVILTDKRFIILKSAAVKISLAVTIPVVIVIGALTVMLPRSMGYMSKALIAAIVGGVVGGLISLITKKSAKNKRDTNTVAASEIVASIDRENIENVEDGNRGVRKMLVINFKDGSLFKIGAKNKDDWRSELLKKV